MIAGINCHNFAGKGTEALVACVVSLLRMNSSTYLGSVWLLHDCLHDPTHGLP